MKLEFESLRTFRRDKKFHRPRSPVRPPGRPKFYETSRRSGDTFCPGVGENSLGVGVSPIEQGSGLERPRRRCKGFFYFPAGPGQFRRARNLSQTLSETRGDWCSGKELGRRNLRAFRNKIERAG